MRPRYDFRSPKYRQLKPKLAIILVVLGIFIGIFAVYRTLHPFQSLNPLYHEITVGEKVIDNWTYNGKNAQGYLVFYNKMEQVHLLPPNAQQLALDGQYVLIREATANSLTYEDPGESFSFLWVVPGLLLGGMAILFLSKKRRGKWRVRRNHYPLVLGKGMWLRKILLFFKYR